MKNKKWVGYKDGICENCGVTTRTVINKEGYCKECWELIECEHQEVIVGEDGFLHCEICGEPVEDRVRSMFM